MNSTYIPNVYPHIVSIRPANGGVNNLGFGKDTQNQEYLLKTGAKVCIAEFVGAALCEAVGIEHCQPKVVTMTDLGGAKVHVFGSVLEPSLLNFNMRNIAEWQSVLAMMPKSPFFTKVLAVDLSLGNDDRHQDNWLVRAPSKHSFQHEMLAMDFSNSWPVCAPPTILSNTRRRIRGDLSDFGASWELRLITRIFARSVRKSRL